jgi:hypothetical protein
MGMNIVSWRKGRKCEYSADVWGEGGEGIFGPKRGEEIKKWVDKNA